VSRAKSGKAAPDGRSLAVTLGEAALNLAAALVKLGQLGLDLPAGVTPLACSSLGIVQLARMSPELLGEKPGPKLRRGALEAGVDVSGLRLALQRAQAAAGLALDIEGSVEVGLRSLQLQLSPAAALSMLA
jgi:hypothetical protein